MNGIQNDDGPTAAAGTRTVGSQAGVPAVAMDVEQFDGLPDSLGERDFMRCNRALPLPQFYRAVICYVSDYRKGVKRKVGG